MGGDFGERLIKYDGVRKRDRLERESRVMKEKVLEFFGIEEKTIK